MMARTPSRRHLERQRRTREDLEVAVRRYLAQAGATPCGGARFVVPATMRDGTHVEALVTLEAVVDPTKEGPDDGSL